MKGHPFSLEHVFALEMPLFYKSKYPHMSHMLHHHVQGHEPVPVYVPKPEYDHPVSGYPKPKHGASLEEIFGVATRYHEPAPTYHAPEPAYHAPEPAYHAPPKKEYILPEHKPAYNAPEPAYHAPEPAYHAPEPAYHAPEPAYHEPKPAYHAPEPAYHAPKPAYHAPEPAYHEPKHDYGYMMFMQPPKLGYVVPTKPSYKAPKKGYGYEAPHHGGSLEEIFGLGAGYGAPPAPAYAPPAPAYAPPAPAYHAPKPSYSPPKLDYLVPKPSYEAPKPAYHAPEPAYHAPEPAYHAPEPAYHAPPKPAYKPKSGYGYAPPSHGGSLEDVFGIVKELPDRLYATPRPDYHPTTYKPKMPDYLHHGDPGYTLHYLPYDDYVPHHAESIAHGPPVPHAPGAAHILVPGTHVLPELRMPHPPHVRSMQLHGARVKRSAYPGRNFVL